MVPNANRPRRTVAASMVHQLARLYRGYRLRGAGRLIRTAARCFPSLQRLPADTLDGRVLYLDLRDETCLTYYLLGHIPTDRWETELVRNVVLPGESALDIGAFVGWYSTLLAERVGPTGVVYAFEPNPTSYKLLALSAAPYPQLHALNAAVGATTASSPLYVPQHLHSSSLRPTATGDAVRSCDVLSLDDFLAAPGRRPPIFVKCDAEGAEAAILEGAARFLRDHAAIWLVEICADTATRFGVGVEQVLEGFRSGVGEEYQGYRIEYPSGALRPILERPLTGIFNAVFVPASLAPRLSSLPSA